MIRYELSEPLNSPFFNQVVFKFIQVLNDDTLLVTSEYLMLFSFIK